MRTTLEPSSQNRPAHRSRRAEGLDSQAAGGEGGDMGTDLALSSFGHQSWWGRGQRQPGLVACAVEPGALDLVVARQGGVTIPPVDERGVLWDFTLVGEGSHTNRK